LRAEAALAASKTAIATAVEEESASAAAAETAKTRRANFETMSQEARDMSVVLEEAQRGHEHIADVAAQDGAAHDARAEAFDDETAIANAIATKAASDRITYEAEIEMNINIKNSAKDEAHEANQKRQAFVLEAEEYARQEATAVEEISTAEAGRESAHSQMQHQIQKKLDMEKVAAEALELMTRANEKATNLTNERVALEEEAHRAAEASRSAHDAVMNSLNEADKTAAEAHLAEVTETHAGLAIKLNALKAEEEAALHWKKKNQHAVEEAHKRVTTATEHEAIARGHAEDYEKRIKAANKEFVKATEARAASEKEANEQSDIEAAAHKRASNAQDATVRLNQESEMAIIAAAEANERASKATV